MRIPGRDEIETLRREWPKGTRVRLRYMADVQAPAAGTEGTVVGADDVGSILVDWDNGSRLNLIPEEDSFERLEGTDA